MPRILIIDDEKCIRETLGEFSEMLGYEPILVDDPSLCGAFYLDNHDCSKEQPCADIMLVDQFLPTMFGLDYVESQTQKGCKVPAGARAIITGALTSEEKERAKSLGCDVLLKPVTFEKLKSWIDSIESNMAQLSPIE